MLSHFPCIYLIALIHRTCICSALTSLSENFSAGDFICLPTQQSASLCYLSSSTGRLVFGPLWIVTYTSKKCFMFPTRQEDNGVATKKKVEIPTRRLGEDVPKPRISHPPVERNVSPVVSRLQSHCAERRHVPRLCQNQSARINRSAIR